MNEKETKNTPIGEETTIIPAMGVGNPTPAKLKGTEDAPELDETPTTIDATTGEETDGEDADEYAGTFDPETHARDHKGSFRRIPLPDKPGDADEATDVTDEDATETMSASGVTETDETTTPPSIPPVDTDDDEDSSHGSNRKRNIIIAASIAAILLLAAGAGGYAYACNNVNAGMQAAAAQATNVDKQLSDKLKEAQTLLDGTTKEQVADEATLTKLADAVKTADSQQGVDESTASRWFVWQTMGAQSAYDSDAEDAQAVIESLDKTMDAVNDSINDKLIADAKAKLDQLVADAQKLYDSTDGKVQDNATRDALKTALDNATKNDVTSVDALDKLTAALNDAQTKVNDSVKAKEQADAEAQAQAEAAANAAASANTGYTGGYSGGYSGYTGGGYSNSSSGGYTGGGYTGGGNYAGNTSGGGSYHGGDTDSVGGVWSEMNSNCAIYGSDGSVTEIPCS